MDNTKLSSDISALSVKVAFGPYFEYERNLKDADRKFQEALTQVNFVVNSFDENDGMGPKTSLEGPARELNRAYSEFKKWLQKAI